jgi:hypothetical protein
MTAQLYAPKVYLFAFHLFKTPDADTNSSVKDPNLLWDKCHDIFSKFHIKQQLKLHPPIPENRRFDLLNGENLSDIALEIKTEIRYKDHELKLEGFAYPLQLYDTYALGLNLGFPDPQPQNSHKIPAVDTSVLEQFNPDSCFLPETIKSYFGQTIIITAWLSEEQKQQDAQFLEDLADECIREFVYDPNKRPELYQKGQLFGSPIFEYGLINERENYRHIVVWLFSDPETDKKFQKSYQLLFDLFFYRNKIITEFWNSRDTYRDAYQEYGQIQKLVSKTFNELPQTDTLSEENLKYLKGQLKAMAKRTVEYSDLLRDLESRRNSIAIHTDNYKSKLRIIENRLDSAKEHNLSFLASFAQENCRVFQEQIQGDLGYFVPGASLLEKAISSIRGIVEIDQAERDRLREDREKKREEEEETKQEERELKEKEKERRLERTVQTLGVALGTGGLVASSFNHIDKPFALPGSPKATDTLHPVTVTLFWSFLIALVFGGVTWWITRPKQ